VLTVPARLLGDADRAGVQRLLDNEPYAAAQVAEQVYAYGLAWWRTEARIFGYGHRTLESVCWLGHNLIPVRAGRPAVAAFAELAALNPRGCSAIVGPAEQVHPLWGLLRDPWGPAREVRASQPLLVTAEPPVPRPDPAVRLVRPDQVDRLLPAAVAMYTGEVGVSPLADGGGPAYRRRLADLVGAGRCYASFAGDEVVFKAELAVVTRHTAQIQGVWVAPQWRGRGLAGAGLSAVVADALRRVAPTVSLYVNDYNAAALALYRRCGFRQVGTFATVLF